ncbi:MAG: alpha-mannosidase [Clostridia bacterium]|nr:alpha-mannosidase [Clostridia bacterium]
MLAEKQVERMLNKLKRLEETLNPMLFKKVGRIDNVLAYETLDRLYEIPDPAMMSPVESGWVWGAEESFCWFKTDFAVPEELDGQNLYLMPHTEGYETLLWVNGKPFGTFCTKIVFTGHGNHYCDLLKMNVKSGEKIDIALEVYSGHTHLGTQPFETNRLIKEYRYTFGGMDICVKDELINDFYFDLKVINELVESLPGSSFRRGDLVNALYEVHKRVCYAPEDVDEETFRECLKAAHPFLKEMLAVKNGPEAAEVCVIGHSHLDTAWLWKATETIKKSARTYSNAISMMEQYPEFLFVQSSACHSDMIRKHYPSLFEDIRKKVAEHRYEPNGAVWVECDCNITSGEAMVRQFLWGQRFTRKYFDFTSNCFWLPDTFGYSAAIPQIMKGCKVDYFLTTKIDWNDVNRFPYDTFYWKGIDGTTVFTHFNKIPAWPSPADLHYAVTGDTKDGMRSLNERSVTRKRICAFGHGDGGGGPQFEMVETARRIKDLNGCAKAEFSFVGDYMKKIEADVKNPSTYAGELYLELHRGTLTNQHNIKHNNRKAELALHDLEYLTVSKAVSEGAVAEDTRIRPLYEKLLLNQFHDILPGTCIPSAHKLSLEETGEVLKKAAEYIAETVDGNENYVSVTNTLSFDRNDAIFLECEEGLVADIPCRQQTYKNLDGKNILIISGVSVPAFSTVKIRLVEGVPDEKSAITVSDDAVSTPFADIRFNEKGYMESFFDKRVNREVRGEGYALNTFLMAEDLPSAWDNWDIDADLESKFADDSVLISREVISHGAAALIIRSRYAISKKSTVTQDAIYFADSPEIRFDTVMDWQDNHRFLKTAFDTAVQSSFARFEIQFGNVMRPTTRNDSVEKAKFEVVNHKYTDLSETRFGVAILNDSKYGISVNGGQMRLSLHKGGTRPDFEGDRGVHRTVYSFLPHIGGFGAGNVIRPAYELNLPVVAGRGDFEAIALVVPEAENVIVEAIKPCEDNEKAFIARLYEAEGTYTRCPVKFFDGAAKIEVTNMLEEVEGELEGNLLEFRPFEIKTLKISY